MLPVADRAGSPDVLTDWIDGSYAPYSVMDFGAKGDGVTDDSAAFIAAIAAAAAQVEFFGTSLIATPEVVLPVLPTGKSYLITQTLALPAGIRIRGGGFYGGMIQFVPANANSTLFTFYGTAEAQPANIALENLFCFQNSAGNPQTSIGVRLRNFSQFQLKNVVLSNFAVGLWADWGQDLSCTLTSFTQCGRGSQLGGNLAQTQTPVPPAGIRGGPGTPWFDDASFISCKWSQNVLDHNDMGSQQAHGQRLFLSCTFFESSTTPVAGKTNFLFTTRLKGLTIADCWWECGTNGRTFIQLDSVDFDGNAGGVNDGFVVETCHFLYTAATGGTGVLVKRACGGGIYDNTFEWNFGGTSTGINLQDSVNTTRIGPQAWISFPDAEIMANLPNAAIVIGTSPPGGHALDHIGPSLATPTYGASIPINAAQEVQQIAATNGTAFTVQAPTRPRAGFLSISILNSSGGALGALTWTGGAGGFILTGGAWTQPANTLRRQITFQFDQPKNAWVEVARTAADY